MIINFNNLKGIYNKHINMLLDSTGLTTRCQFNFGVSKKSLCPNCIYDPNLKKSSNKYKVGGPVEFGIGKICPVCNGIGSYGEVLSEDAYLAVLWNYKDWVNPPSNITNPEGLIQTICSKDLLAKIRQCKDMTVVVNENLANPVFKLNGEPNFAGLGDNNYIFCIWQKTGSQNIVGPPVPTPTRSPTPTNNTTRTPTPSNSKTPTPTPTSTLFLTKTPTPSNTVTPTITPSNTTSNTPTPTITSTNTPTPSITATNTATPTNTPTNTLSSSITPSASITPSITRSPGVTPTQTPTTTTTPSNTSALFGIGINSANYGNCADWNSLDGNVTVVGTNGGPSVYGTYDQGGNVWEWNEAIISPYRGLRGGAYNSASSYLSSNFRNNNTPSIAPSTYGFRTVSLSGNPYSFSSFVPVGDFINPNDTSPPGYGTVGYLYHIQKYEVTNAEYASFLNSIAVTDTYNCYNTSMGSDNRGGISRSGVNGSYSYTTKTNMSNKPVNFISWFNAARFANWLHNNMPSGSQNSLTTESGAYYLNGTTSDATITRISGAKYALPTEDEWYKAAYYKGGSSNAGYWNYATQSDSIPSCVASDSSGVPLPSVTPTNTPTVTPTITITKSNTTTPTVTRTNTTTPSVTASATPTSSVTPSVTPTLTPTTTVFNGFTLSSIESSSNVTFSGSGTQANPYFISISGLYEGYGNGENISLLTYGLGLLQYIIITENFDGFLTQLSFQINNTSINNIYDTTTTSGSINIYNNDSIEFTYNHFDYSSGNESMNMYLWQSGT
jgi:formylglycine-generating enzyme required for sulfatase activity